MTGKCIFLVYTPVPVAFRDFSTIMHAYSLAKKCTAHLNCIYKGILVDQTGMNGFGRAQNNNGPKFFAGVFTRLISGRQ